MPTSDAGTAVESAVRRMAEEVRSTDIFQMLDANEALYLAGICERCLLGPGDSLFHEGQPGQTLYVVLRGELQIIVRSPDGDAEVVVGLVQSGNLVGEMAVLEAAPRSATVRASGPCELLSMPGRAFAELVASGHPAAFAILRQLQHSLSDRLRELDDRVDVVMEGDEAEPRKTGLDAALPASPEPTLWHLIDGAEKTRRNGGSGDSNG